MSSQFDFLKNLQPLEEVKKQSKTRNTYFKSPEEADLRVCRNGAVYPSTALVEKMNLEYKNASDPEQGNGLDVLLSSDWAPAKNWPTKVVLVAAVPKDEPKVSLFKLCNRNKETGEVETSVLDQGSTSFGKDLLYMLKEAYGVTPNENGYIDLNIMHDTPVTTSNGVYYIPKKIVRGDKAGEVTTERREHLVLHPLVVVDSHVSAEVKEEEESKEEGGIDMPEITVSGITPAEPATEITEEVPVIEEPIHTGEDSEPLPTETSFGTAKFVGDEDQTEKDKPATDNEPEEPGNSFFNS